jgi:RNA polymerase sigma-70 factor (ECF subfamily)
MTAGAKAAGSLLSPGPAAAFSPGNTAAVGIKFKAYSLERGKVSGLQANEFEALALPLLDPLYNFARWLGSDADEARDLVQETFAKALKGLGSFQPGTNFRAWMFRILRNTFLTSRTGLERRNTEQEAEEGFEDSVASHDTPEVSLIRRADIELVQQEIGRLSPGFREVLVLADVEEMKYQEIADALDVPIGTVMSRLARARRQLRQQIARRLEGSRTVGAKP